MKNEPLSAQAQLLNLLLLFRSQHVPVDTLAARARMSEIVVRAVLQELWDQGYVTCTIGADGMICAARCPAMPAG
ncbi:MAG TPA: hypothetical protein P5305_08980 [Rubrivivax sp.]|nr:hypothetical protein [Rubrivivax sp.]HRY88009.1 hypothetical protein [Rubrivivax sp.]